MWLYVPGISTSRPGTADSASLCGMAGRDAMSSRSRLRLRSLCLRIALDL